MAQCYGHTPDSKKVRIRNRWKPPLIMNRISTAIGGVLALAIAAPVAATGDGAINWSITPYLWATETKQRMNSLTLGEESHDKPAASTYQ